MATWKNWCLPTRPLPGLSPAKENPGPCEWCWGFAAADYVFMVFGLIQNGCQLNPLFLHAPQRYASGNGQVVNLGLKGIAAWVLAWSAGQYAFARSAVIAFQKLAGAAEGAITALARK